MAKQVLTQLIIGEPLVNIPVVPVNLVNSEAGALKTQLNLVNAGGGPGAGSAIDFHTYDVAGGIEPGARVAAFDDNFSAFLGFYTKNPGAATNPINERMRITSTGQLAIGSTAPSSVAKVQIDSTTQGFLPPRMTSAQRLAIATPPQGLCVYDITLNALCFYSGAYWAFETNLNTTAIQTTTLNTYANITELVTQPLEAGLYAIRFRGLGQSTVLATGYGLRLAVGTATISEVAINWTFTQAGAGTDKDFEYQQISLADNITSASVVTANANFAAHGDGVFRVSVAGTVAIQIRSENNGTGVSIRPNSTVIFKKVGT
jgi:hypothetical protein